MDYSYHVFVMFQLENRSPLPFYMRDSPTGCVHTALLAICSICYVLLLGPLALSFVVVPVLLSHSKLKPLFCPEKYVTARHSLLEVPVRYSAPL